MIGVSVLGEDLFQNNFKIEGEIPVLFLKNFKIEDEIVLFQNNSKLEDKVVIECK